MQKIKTFIESNTWVVLLVLALIIAGTVYWTFRPDAAGSLTADVNTQTWIDVDGNVFQHQLRAFDNTPVLGPTGKPAFRAEMCYWTRDGKTKTTGTAVLLNSHLAKPEPTFCPDCGRLVRALNPPPTVDVPDAEQRVPPTRDEYEKSRQH